MEDVEGKGWDMDLSYPRSLKLNEHITLVWCEALAVLILIQLKYIYFYKKQNLFNTSTRIGFYLFDKEIDTLMSKALISLFTYTQQFL